MTKKWDLGGHFSSFGLFSLFEAWTISHFEPDFFRLRLSAPFTFYARLPDSKTQSGRNLGLFEEKLGGEPLGIQEFRTSCSGRRAKCRRGSSTVSTPFKTHRADFKIEERSRKDRGRSRKDQGKIEEDRGKDQGISRNIEKITFSLVSRLWAIFVTLEFLGIFGQMVCADGLHFGARFRLWS